MLWAARTRVQGSGKPVLFYVLPYQTSINAMQLRLARSLGTTKVALQHSRAAQAIYRQLLDRDYEPRSPPASHAKNGRWQSFMQSRFAY